jgi:arylsulfate sulfotransferase
MRNRFYRPRLLLLIILLALATPAWAVGVVSSPTLTMDPNGVTPLAGRIDLTTTTPVRITLSVRDGFEAWAVEFPDFATSHSLPLLGLKPNDTYTIEVSAIEADGTRTLLSPTLRATTPPLPADFPHIAVYYTNPSKMEPGFTLLDRTRRPGFTGNLYGSIVDNQGVVRWYSTMAGQDGMQQLPNGNLLLLDSSEVDLLGNHIVRRTLQVPGLLLHHDIFPTDSGNFFSLSLEEPTVANFPTSETDPNAPTQTQKISADAVVEFRADGTVQNIWHLTDLLDTHRIGYDSTKIGFPLFDAADWSHSNAVLYDNRDDSIIVSVRHQDSVVKFSRATGKIKWILGPHDNWGPEFQPYLLTPVGTPFEWQFHQHAPMLTPQGTLLLMDNGNYRASPFDGRTPLQPSDSYGRAVEYAIDETAMQVRQVWEYGATIPWRLYSASQGDADRMPTTGNVLITFSDTQFIAGLPTSQWGLGASHAAIVEVTHDSPAQVVFDMHVYDPDPASKTYVYRSERIPLLYAPGVRFFVDTDHDGVIDDVDNCTALANADQRDTDHDGFGNACDADLNNDGHVDGFDWLQFAAAFDTSTPDADFDGDGVVGWSDAVIIYTALSGIPGPSALHR